MNELPEKYYVHTNFPEEANDVAKYFNAMGRYFGTFSCNFYYSSANQMNGGRLHPKDEFPVYEYSEWKQKLKNPTVMNKLPNEYFIQCSTKEESDEAIKFVKKRTSWPIDVMWKYIAKHVGDKLYDNLWDSIPNRFCHYPIIPFAQWKKLLNPPIYTIDYLKTHKVAITISNREDHSKLLKDSGNTASLPLEQGICALYYQHGDTKGYTSYTCLSGADVWYAAHDYEIIDFSQIQFETNMEKKIIGYKLSKPEYEKQAANIAYTENTPPYNEKFTIVDKANGANFLVNSYAENRLRKAGVLDLWFEPVYEEEFKVGDWVIMKETADGRDEWKEAFQIHKLTPVPVAGSGYYCYRANGDNRFLNEFRKATPAEIAAAEKITIAGYDMEIVGKGTSIPGAKFGCQTLYGNELQTIRKIMGSEIGAVISLKGTVITTELIDKIINHLRNAK